MDKSIVDIIREGDGLFANATKDAPPKTAAEAVRRRLEMKRKLAAQCSYYYPILCTDKCSTQQVAAAQTVEGAVTIKETLERRYPKNKYSIGPGSIVMSDALIRLEFEPSELERIELEQEKRALQAVCYEVDHPTPARIRQIVEGMPK